MHNFLPVLYFLAELKECYNINLYDFYDCCVSNMNLFSFECSCHHKGRFNNLISAQYFARIKSYIETGHRFGIGFVYVKEKTLEGKPLTIEEMKKHDDIVELPIELDYKW